MYKVRKSFSENRKQTRPAVFHSILEDFQRGKNHSKALIFSICKANFFVQTFEQNKFWKRKTS